LANFVVLAEIIPWPFVVLAEIVAVSRPPIRLAKVLHSEPTAWEEHFKARQKYVKALEAWRQSEHLVNLNTQRTAAACESTGDHTSQTAHHVRKALAGSVVGKMVLDELFEENLVKQEV
jgi:hypothetical protein